MKCDLPFGYVVFETLIIHALDIQQFLLQLKFDTQVKHDGFKLFLLGRNLFVAIAKLEGEASILRVSDNF